jgi:hypothetical protein
VSKNLVINGVEIYTQIAGAISAYKRAEFYDFGYHLGLAVDELALKSQMNEMSVKSMNDVNAYKFLTGFFIPIKLIEKPAVNYQNLYNSIKGGLIIGPVQKVMNELEKST